MKVTILSIHPRVITSPVLAPPDGVIHFNPTGDGQFKGEVDETVALALISVGRKGEFVLVPADESFNMSSSEKASVSAHAASGSVGKGSQPAAAPSPSLKSKIAAIDKKNE
jgi:hypothetical protein